MGMNQNKTHSSYKKMFSTVRTVKHWKRLSRQVVQSLPLELSKNHHVRSWTTWS